MFALLLVISIIALPLGAGPVLAQDGGEDEAGDASEGGEAGEGNEAGEEGEESGIEGAIEGFVEGLGLLGAVLVLALGMILLTVCVERLISYLTRAALGLKMSLFALAIVFTGFEFDDTILGLALSR